MTSAWRGRQREVRRGRPAGLVDSWFHQTFRRTSAAFVFFSGLSAVTPGVRPRLIGVAVVTQCTAARFDSGWCVSHHIVTTGVFSGLYLYLSSRFQPALFGNSSKSPEQALTVYKPQAHPDFQMESVTVADAAIYGVITA